MLTANNVIDQQGRFMGECLPAEAAAAPALSDMDTDGDLLPDACDPCPTVLDPTYRFTGVVNRTDTDGDGVPDACDNCALDANSDQSDDDGDGHRRRLRWV